MSIFSETIVDGQSLVSRQGDDALPILRISDSPLDLHKGTQLLYSLGSLATDDNVPASLEAFEQTFPVQKPLLHAWLGLVSPYVDQHLLKGMMANGLESMIPGYLRSAHLLMEHAQQPAQVHLVSYPAMEEIMRQYPQIDARPDQFFCDHALSVAARILGPYVASNLCCIKQKDGSWRTTGTKRPIAEILKATENLSLMGNSFGTSFTIQLENALGLMLRQLDYSPGEIHSAMTSVRAFGFSSVSPFAAIKDSPCRTVARFTTVKIQGINDVIAQTLCRHKAFPTLEEIRRSIPLELQGDVRKAIARYRDDVKHRLSDPQAEPYPPSKNPDDIENMEFLILRNVAANRMLVMTPVPTFAQRWAFEVPGKATQRYLEDLHTVLDSFTSGPRDRNSQSYRTAYAKKYDLFMHVMQGGENAQASAQALLQELPAERRAPLEAALGRIASQSRQFEGFMSIMTQDRAGHNMAFYQLQHERLLRLSQRIVANMLRYGDLSAEEKQAYRAEDMLLPLATPQVDMFHPRPPHPLDVLLDRDILPQLAAMEKAGKGMAVA